MSGGPRRTTPTDDAAPVGADDAAPMATGERPAPVEMCLVLVVREREVHLAGTPVKPARELLLGVKRRGFGEGRVVAPGGKIDAGETPAEAARRELREETSLCAATLEPAGIVDFAFPDDPAAPDLRAHVFTTSDVRGIAASSDEIDVLWVALNSVPYHRMWPDARHWLPDALAGTLRHARFIYAADGRTLAEWSLA